MRIHCIMCVKNEKERYLHASLEWHRGQFDSYFIYDDQSDDGTLEFLQNYGDISVETRPDSVPSFMEHEGKFRQAAFNSFVDRIEPDEGDWILSLDADEFAVTDYGALYQTLRIITSSAEDAGTASLDMQIPEVWNLLTLDLRIDGFWGSLSSPRLWRYIPPVEFANKSMACGSWPTYISNLQKHNSIIVKLYHFGYAVEADRIAKHQRYKGLPGHNPTHIESIVKQPLLAKWSSGTKPHVWRGVL